MKKIVLYKAVLVLAVTTLSGGLMPAVRGQTSNPPPAVPAQPVPLSPAVQELAHADVSDDTIVAYINSSGAVYNLGASDIVYLRQQGVSNPVITAMLNARPNAPAVAQVAPPAAPVPAPPDGTSQPPPDAMQAAPVYDGSAYSMPSYGGVAPGYYGAAPYYYGYPGVSLGIGLGFGVYYGGYLGVPGMATVGVAIPITVADGITAAVTMGLPWRGHH